MNMDKEQIRNILYKKYIEPTKQTKQQYIGVEIEMPIINLDKQAVDFEVVHSVTHSFIKEFGFENSGKDDEGNIFSTTSPKSGDILSYDCSYNNLELSFGKEVELFAIKSRFERYYSFLQAQFSRHNYTLTGLGVNPYRIYNHNVPIPNGRYRMLFHHLGTYKNYDLPMHFHNHPEFGTFSSASQVQLDLSYDNLPKTLNTFSKLEPIKALLFSNSILLDEQEDIICCRDMLWENSTHGINPHNVGMYDTEFKTQDEVLDYLETTSIYCVERDDKYINFKPINIVEYLQSEAVEGEYYSNGEYKKITVIPCESDISYLRTFNFEDLTFRGTVEFRSVCCQPIADSLTVAAFHLGLLRNLDRLSEILENDRVIYHKGYTPAELRAMFVKSSLPDFVDKESLYALAKEIVDLAGDGLRDRGFGEEMLLAPLYDRIKNQTNPSKELLKRRAQGESLEQIIKAYSKIK
jgi:gamma-glutamylcysteine synthetase